MCEECLVNRKGFKEALWLVEDSALYMEWMIIHTNNKRYCYICQKADSPYELEHLIINSEGTGHDKT